MNPVNAPLGARIGPMNVEGTRTGRIQETAKPSHMSPRDLQETNERRFSKKHINGYIDTAIRENPESEAKVQDGIVRMNNWLDTWITETNTACSSDVHWKRKNARLVQVQKLDVEELVRSILVGIAYVQQPQLLVSVTAQLASKIGFDDKRDAIMTMAEMVGVLSHTDAFDITRETPEASVMVTNTLHMPEAIKDAIKRSQYLPPMVCVPETLTNNYESGYLTHNDCVILGKGNGHEDDVCLDVINIQNQVELKLAKDFLCTLEETPNPDKELDDAEKRFNWELFKFHSYQMYDMIIKQGNSFYLTNKVDCRLRLYSQGYHINTQGAAFKKASIEFANEEIVKGVPVCKSP